MRRYAPRVISNNPYPGVGPGVCWTATAAGFRVVGANAGDIYGVYVPIEDAVMSLRCRMEEPEMKTNYESCRS